MLDCPVWNAHIMIACDCSCQLQFDVPQAGLSIQKSLELQARHVATLEQAFSTHKITHLQLHQQAQATAELRYLLVTLSASSLPCKMSEETS